METKDIPWKNLLLQWEYSALSNAWIYNFCKKQEHVLILVSVLKINVFEVSGSAGCDTDCEIFSIPRIESEGSQSPFVIKGH